MLLGDACYWSCMSIFFLSFLCQNNNNKKKSRQTTRISPIRININNTSGKTECMASPVACGLNRSHCKVCATASHAGHRGAAQSWKKKKSKPKNPNNNSCNKMCMLRSDNYKTFHNISAFHSGNIFPFSLEFSTPREPGMNLSGGGEDRKGLRK